MPHLVIDKLSASYGKTPVLKEIGLAVERGDIVSIIGPSGSGKSTLLRVLVGLLKPTAGTVTIAGDVVNYDKPAGAQAGARPICCGVPAVQPVPEHDRDPQCHHRAGPS